MLIMKREEEDYQKSQNQKKKIKVNQNSFMENYKRFNIRAEEEGRRLSYVKETKVVEKKEKKNIAKSR